MNARDINPVELLSNGLIDFVADKCTKLGNNPEEPDFVAV